MGAGDLVAWYQKKIGTYDKQEWEKTIEQRISEGFANIQMKSAKLKENFMDLDLVRGSSFTKAKPKHSLFTVAQLATLRLFFLPAYWKWWTKQSSKNVYAVLLTLYVLQLILLLLYVFNTIVSTEQSENVTSSEVIIPMIMMWILSVIQSQIGATNNDPKPFLKGTFSRKFRRRKRKIVTGCDEKSDFMSSGQKDDGESSEYEKPYEDTSDAQVASSIKQNNVNLRLSRSRKRVCSGHTYDDGFESLRSNATSSSDNNEEIKVPKTRGRSYAAAANDVEINFKSSNKDAETNTTKYRSYNRRISEPNLVFRNDVESVTDDGRHSHKQIDPKQSCGLLESTYDSDDHLCPRSASVNDVVKKSSDCTGVTTNSSDVGESDSQYEYTDRDYIDDFDVRAATMTPMCLSRKEAVSCTVWKNRELKKAELTVLDISSAIIAKVETMPNNTDYFYLGALLSLVLALIPALCRLCNSVMDTPSQSEIQLTIFEIIMLLNEKISCSLEVVFKAAFGSTTLEKLISVIASLERYILSFFFFFMLAVAERTFKQRFLYAKFFTHLTSSRRAKNSQLPHFRLNKVRNIKTWLSVRSYLKKRGPLRSVDVIVSSAFIITIILLSFLSMELLRDSIMFNSQYNLEAMVWSIGLGVYLMRFLTLGTKINRKYRNFSVLIMEQMNLYLQIEQKPQKKDELMVANSVLKLAIDLLKELESPFKILGLSANPIVYTVTKVFILSALSAVLSEFLGFKLKLHKIKLK